MNKLFLTITILLITASSLYAQQQIKGLVVNKLSKHPLTYASIKLKSSQSGTVTNEDGQFVVLKSVSKIDTLEISSLGYKTINIPFLSLSINQLNTFELEESISVLDEVVIKPIKIKSILNEVLRKSDSAYNSPVLLKGYYREYVKRDSFLTKYADGILSYLVRKSSKKVPSIDLYVSQSRSKVTALNEEDDKFNDLNSPIDVEKMGEYANPVRGFNLDTNAYPNFIIKLYEIEEGGKDIYAINFEPKIASAKTLFHGNLYVDKERLLVIGYDFSYAPISAAFYRKVSILGITASAKSYIMSGRYNISPNAYSLSYLCKKFSMQVSSKKYNQKNHFKSEFFTYNIETDNLKPQGEKYSKRALYKRGNKYENEFWKNKYVIANTKEETEFLLKEN